MLGPQKIFRLVNLQNTDQLLFAPCYIGLNRLHVVRCLPTDRTQWRHAVRMHKLKRNFIVATFLLSRSKKVLCRVSASIRSEIWIPRKLIRTTSVSQSVSVPYYVQPSSTCVRVRLLTPAHLTPKSRRAELTTGSAPQPRPCLFCCVWVAFGDIVDSRHHPTRVLVASTTTTQSQCARRALEQWTLPSWACQGRVAHVGDDGDTAHTPLLVRGPLFALLPCPGLANQAAS